MTEIGDERDKYDDVNEQFSLHSQIDLGDIEEICRLIKSGKDVNEFDEMGWSPLHHAVREENFEIVELLLKMGADINGHDETTIGNTPIGDAAGRGTLEMVKYLLGRGANPNIRGWMRLSAVERARKRNDKEGVEIQKILFEASKKFPLEDVN